MSLKFLKVKIKSLAAEARIIRREERRALGRRKSKHRRRDLGRGFVEKDPAYNVIIGRDTALYLQLRQHRLVDVRAEQRAALLAYAFLRGRSRAAVEPRRAAGPAWLVERDEAARLKRVAHLVEKYGTRPPGQTKAVQEATLAAWMTGSTVAVV